MATFLEYMDAAMGHAHYDTLNSGSSGIYAHIPGFEGLWVMGSSMQEARAHLYMALDIWLSMNLFVSRLDPPDVGVSLSISRGH